MGHAADADEGFELAGDELRAVVADDPGRDAGIAFAGPLHDRLDFRLGHGRPDLPMHDQAAVAIEDAAQVVKGAGDVEIGDIDMPVFMRKNRLVEAFSFAGRLAVMPLQAAGFLQDAIDAGRADRNQVAVEHHEGQAAIAFERVLGLEVEDRLLFPIFEPVIAWDFCVVLVHLAVPLLPGLKLTGGNTEPADQGLGRQFGFVGPVVDVIDDLVADIVGRPAAD